MEHEMEYMDVEVIVMTDENGEDVEWAILDEFNMGGQDYMILSPSIDGVCGGQVEYFSVTEDGDDLSMELVEDEELLNRIRDVFRSRMVK